jgi:hypothetical protein
MQVVGVLGTDSVVLRRSGGNLVAGVLPGAALPEVGDSVLVLETLSGPVAISGSNATDTQWFADLHAVFWQGGRPLTDQELGDFPLHFNGEIISITILGDFSSAVNLDVLKATYAEHPEYTPIGPQIEMIGPRLKLGLGELGAWDRSIINGDQLRFAITFNSGFHRLSVCVEFLVYLQESA